MSVNKKFVHFSLPSSSLSHTPFLTPPFSHPLSQYHPSCFKLSLIEDHCSLGDFEQIIVPPFWIVFGSKVSLNLLSSSQFIELF